ncbi:MAG: SCO family protein [Daejeonella sp.]|uniref:SCO family protein n=1 Tax=Daejeonella sp. JGW-45 TaxID=3034148 RepID=UPI0023EB6588|nr:SCO family protein [Daejeonella sp. JGW-45]
MKYLLLFATAICFLQACSNKTESKLPILGERAPVEKIVDGKTVVDTIYQTIAPFAYLNQDSVVISDKDFENKIYVTDFFFTACNTICPVMHRNMMEVYKQYKDNPHVKILSHSIDVKYDVPSRLKAYADKLGVESDKWAFVHGSRDSIFNVAAKSYLVAAYEDASDKQGLVHQGWFVLVDTKKRLRGAYDGTKPDQVKLMMADMEKLLKEENLNEK